MLLPFMPEDLFHFSLLVSHPECKDRQRLWVKVGWRAGGIRLSVCLLGGAQRNLGLICSHNTILWAFHSKEGEKNKLGRLKKVTFIGALKIDSLPHC